MSSGIRYCRDATECPVTADGKCVDACQHFRYELGDGTVLCVNYCPPDGKYDIVDGVKVCSASGENQVVEDNPLCDAMLRDNVVQAKLFCDDRNSFYPADEGNANTTSVVELAGLKIARQADGLAKYDVHCKFTWLNHTQAAFRTRDVFVNALVDAAGCTSLDVSLADSVTGSVDTAKICGQVNITNAPAYAFTSLYKLAPGYGGKVASSMSYFVSVTGSVNATECAGECLASVKDQASVVGHEGACGVDFRLNLTSKSYDIRVSAGYDNETLAQVHYTQLHKIWLQNYLYHYGQMQGEFFDYATGKRAIRLVSSGLGEASVSYNAEGAFIGETHCEQYYDVEAKACAAECAHSVQNVCFSACPPHFF